MLLFESRTPMNNDDLTRNIAGGRGKCRYCLEMHNNVALHEAHYCKERPQSVLESNKVDIHAAAKDEASGSIVVRSEDRGGKYQIKVGKRPGNGVYVQASAIDGGRSNLKPWEIEAYQDAKRILFTGHPDFQYDFVHIDNHAASLAPIVRFMKMSSLFDAHPYVMVSKIVNLEVNGQIEDGRINGQIYHRLETMVDPIHPSYIFHKSVANWEISHELLGTPDVPKAIGTPSVWKAWVETKIPYSAYEQELAIIFAKTVDVAETPDRKEDNAVELHIARTSGRTAGPDEIHVELVDAKTRKFGIRAAFTFEEFSRALMGEFNVVGRNVRWNFPPKSESKLKEKIHD
jgi:hypothetical protein